MDIVKVRELSDTELENALREAKQDLWGARFALSTRQLKDYSMIPQTRRQPGVTGVTPLTPGAWGAVGGRRYVHLSDGSQTITPAAFSQLMAACRRVAEAVDRTM